MTAHRALMVRVFAVMSHESCIVLPLADGTNSKQLKPMVMDTKLHELLLTSSATGPGNFISTRLRIWRAPTGSNDPASNLTIALPSGPTGDIASFLGAAVRAPVAPDPPVAAPGHHAIRRHMRGKDLDGAFEVPRAILQV